MLGKGGFGTVRFALSLFRNRSNCGDVICIKKTRSFAALTSHKHQNTLTPLQRATEAIIEDYFAGDVANKVYAPQIFDLAIVSDSFVNEKEDPSGKGCHQKGYLMMELFPQNTATKIFLEPKYQKWKYQKPFLQGIMLSTSELLKERKAFTDLKPDNALFDPDNFKTTIIDLGGIVPLEKPEDIMKFDKYHYRPTATKRYCAPEMLNANNFNLSKALAYSCGKVMEEVVQNSDYKKEEFNHLITELTQPNPDQRISIDEALEFLKKIGDDTDNKYILLEQYIHEIKKCIMDDRSSISLNDDIHTTKELYIDLRVTLEDPERYGEQETEDLFQRIDTFFAPDQLKHQVMALFGSAGSGKSIALQLKFIEAIQKWEKGRSLPLYFNLANGIDLKSAVNSMNSELGTNVKLQELPAVHLYIDSFDEGLEIEKNRETLVKDYVTQLKNLSVKILITCRSNYLENESSTRWFTPQINAFDRLVTCYVAPLSYVASRKIEKNDSNMEGWIIVEGGHEDGSNLNALEKSTQEEKKENGGQKELGWSEKVASYLGFGRQNEDYRLSPMISESIVEKEGNRDQRELNCQKNVASYLQLKWEYERKKNDTLYPELKQKKEDLEKALEKTLEKMALLNLDKLIDTGLIFHIVMEVLLDLLEDKNQSKNKSKQDIYLQYVTNIKERG